MNPVDGSSSATTALAVRQLLQTAVTTAVLQVTPPKDRKLTFVVMVGAGLAASETAGNINGPTSVTRHINARDKTLIRLPFRDARLRSPRGRDTVSGERIHG
jgi:hypothetical protein